MSLALEGFLELAHRFGRPLNEALRISFWFQQVLQIDTQGLILVGGPLPPTTFPALLPPILASPYGSSCA